MKDRNRVIAFVFLILVSGVFLLLMRSDLVFVFNEKTKALEQYKSFTPESSNTSVAADERYAVIYDSGETSSVQVKENIVKTLQYIKKDVDIIELDRFKGLEHSYRTVIIAFEALNKLQGMDGILQYVKAGGRVLFAERSLDNDAFSGISRDLGIEDVHSMMNLKGIKLLSNVLIKAKGFTIKDDFMVNSSLNVRLNRSCTVHALSMENKPLLWEVACGSGKLMFFNGSALGVKNSRGLITGMLSILNDDFIYPVMNLKVAFIDDFPAPFPNGVNQNIYQDYQLETPDFYKGVWWPDILKGAKNYNIKYTGMIIEKYNQLEKAPFDKASKDEKINLLIFGRELVKSGSEVGIHGYNHQPLALNGYIKEPLGYQPWEKEADMLDAVREVHEYARSVFPQYDFTSYVPPSNILSPEGRKTLLKALPQLKVISSVYSNNDYGDAYEQEFEISKDGIIELPRITFGYEVNNEILWDAYNGLTSLGVFSHFIHPDDVLDANRNHGKSWRDMNREYHSLMKMVNKDFSWLRPYTATQAGVELMKYYSCKPRFELKDGFLKGECENFVKDQYFIFRTDKKPTVCKNCSITRIDEGVYIICAVGPSFSVKVG